MKKIVLFLVILLGLNLGLSAQWNSETTGWPKNTSPKTGYWGFDRPDYPKGLQIQGVTVKKGKAVDYPVIYDNDVVDDVLEDEWAFITR